MKKLILPLILAGILGLSIGDSQKIEIPIEKRENGKAYKLSLEEEGKDPGNFSLRFAYCIGKQNAKEKLDKPEDTRHSLHNLMTKAMFNYQKGHTDSTFEYLSQLEKKLGEYDKCLRIKLGEMTLYNVLTEVNLELYFESRDIKYLVAADSINKKVFDLEEKEYPAAGIMEQDEKVKEGLDKQMDIEYSEACDNLTSIIRLYPQKK